MKAFVKGALGAAALALVAGPALADKVVDGPRIHWDYSLWGKPRAVTTYLTNLETWLPEQTGGKFTFQIHWGTLSKPRAVLDNLKAGSFQMGSFCASYYPGKLSAHTGLDLPFLPIKGLPMLRAVTHEYYQHPVLVKEMRRWNAKFNMSSLLPLYEIVGKGEMPTSLEGFKGMRIRSLGQQGKAMEKLGAARSAIHAVIGPCISQRAYEVGPELLEDFMAEDPGNARFFAQGEGDRYQFDLPGFGLHRLRAAGVGAAEWTRHCTYSDAARFFSYRRATHAKEADYGRLIAAITL